MKAARSAGLRAIGVVPPYLPADAHRRTLLAAGAEIVIGDVNEVERAVRDL
jgi:HAD superfamily phosphatase